MKIKRIIALVFSILTSSISFACSCREYDLIPDYSKYVANLYRYHAQSDFLDENPSDDEYDEEYVAEKVESLEGFVPIYDYKFDLATPFFGTVAYVTQNDVDYILKIDGTLEKISKFDVNDSTMSDIIVHKLVDNCIVIAEDDKFGVIDVYGNMLLNTSYSNVLIVGKTIVGLKSNSFDLYYDGKFVCSKNGTNVNLLSEEFVLYESQVYKTKDFSLLRFGDYVAVRAPANGLVAVKKNGKIGYCSYPSGELVIDTKYSIYSNFSNGIASVATISNNLGSATLNYPQLINKSDKVVFDFNQFSGKCASIQIDIFPHFDNCTIFRINGIVEEYGAIRINDLMAEYIKLDKIPKDGRVHGDNIIVKDENRLFSISNKSYASNSYQEMVPFGDYFICKSNDLYSIIDKNMDTVISDCEKIEQNYDTIMIKKNGKYSFYKQKTA